MLGGTRTLCMEGMKGVRMKNIVGLFSYFSVHDLLVFLSKHFYYCPFLVYNFSIISRMYAIGARIMKLNIKYRRKQNFSSSNFERDKKK